jgi:cytochrome c553
MQLTTSLLLLSLALTDPLTGFTQTTEALYKSKNCARCHGDDGKGTTITTFSGKQLVVKSFFSPMVSPIFFVGIAST